MSASFQAFPQQGPPQPGMIYPTTTTTTTTTAGTSGESQDSSSHSSGSFGMVFVVLAVILVVSAIACALGRFCTKKSNKSHQPKAHKQSNNSNHNQKNNNVHHNHNHHQGQNNHKNNNNKHGGPQPKDRDLEFGYRSREGDVMLGFEPKVRMPTAKVANNADFRGDGLGSGRGMAKVANNNGDFRGDGFGNGRKMEHGGMPRDFP